jgi:hypothetical protein
MQYISKIAVLMILNLLSISESIARTLFMSDEESRQAIRALKKHMAVQHSINYRKLSGILYVNEDNWTVWIDDIPYSSIGQKDEFSIDEVTEDSVSLTMRDGATINISVNHDNAS